MKSYKCGTMVKTKIGGFDAMITAVIIRFKAVIYELSYCHNGEYKNSIVYEEEFAVTDDSVKKTIGFHKR